MNIQLAVLGIFALLLVLSLVGVLPMLWPHVLICYLATAQAVGVLWSLRS